MRMEQLSNEITGSFSNTNEDDPEDEYARKVTFHTDIPPPSKPMGVRGSGRPATPIIPGGQPGTKVNKPALLQQHPTASCFTAVAQDDCGGPKLPCPGPFNLSTEAEAWSKNIELKDPPREEEDCATACARVKQTKDRICDVVRRRLELMLKHNGCPSRILSEAEAAYYKVPMPGAKPQPTTQPTVGYMPGTMPIPMYNYGAPMGPPPTYWDPAPSGTIPMDTSRTFGEYEGVVNSLKRSR